MVKHEGVQRTRRVAIRLKNPLPADLEINTLLEASPEEFKAALARALAEHDERVAAPRDVAIRCADDSS